MQIASDRLFFSTREHPPIDRGVVSWQAEEKGWPCSLERRNATADHNPYASPDIIFQSLARSRTIVVPSMDIFKT